MKYFIFFINIFVLSFFSYSSSDINEESGENDVRKIYTEIFNAIDKDKIDKSLNNKLEQISKNKKFLDLNPFEIVFIADILKDKSKYHEIAAEGFIEAFQKGFRDREVSSLIDNISMEKKLPILQFLLAPEINDLEKNVVKLALIDCWKTSYYSLKIREKNYKINNLKSDLKISLESIEILNKTVNSQKKTIEELKTESINTLDGVNLKLLYLKLDDKITPPSTPPIEYEDDLPSRRLLSQVETNNSAMVVVAQSDCSKEFLKSDKKQNNQNSSQFFDSFKLCYDEEYSQEIDITGLSSRARISLLRKIINYKLSKLSYYFPKGYKNQHHQDSFWIKPSTNKLKDKKIETLIKRKTLIKTNINDIEAYDLLPTTFKIGNYQYVLRLGAKSNQRGSGNLSGLYDQEFSGAYSEMVKCLNGIEGKYNKKTGKFDTFSIVDGPLVLDSEKRQIIVKKLVKQKKYGKPITMRTVKENLRKHIERFFNGFNFLLDYEVARRLVDSNDSCGHTDDYPNLPVIFFMKKLIKSYGEETLAKFNGYLLPATKTNESLRKFLSKEKLICSQEDVSPLSGENRDKKLLEITSSVGLLQAEDLSKKLRKKLLYLHKNEETSEESKFFLDEESSEDNSFLIKKPIKSRVWASPP